MNSMVFSQEQIQSSFPECQFLGELMRKIEKQLFEKGNVVCQFRINGMILNEKDEARLSESLSSEIANLEISYQRPETLVVNAVGSWHADLPLLIQHADDLANHLRFKGSEGYLKDFVQLIDECQMLVDSLLAFDSLLSHNAIVESGDWKSNEQFMAKAIGEGLAAFQKKDFALLADILEYDIAHSLQTWLELLEKLKEQIGNGKLREHEDGSAVGALGGEGTSA